MAEEGRELAIGNWLRAACRGLIGAALEFELTVSSKLEPISGLIIASVVDEGDGRLMGLPPKKLLPFVSEPGLKKLGVGV